MSAFGRIVLLLGFASAFLLGCSAMAQAMPQDEAVILGPMLTIRIGAVPVATLGLAQGSTHAVLAWLGAAALACWATAMLLAGLSQGYQVWRHDPQGGGLGTSPDRGRAGREPGFGPPSGPRVGLHGLGTFPRKATNDTNIPLPVSLTMPAQNWRYCAGRAAQLLTVIFLCVTAGLWLSANRAPKAETRLPRMMTPAQIAAHPRSNASAGDWTEP